MGECPAHHSLRIQRHDTAARCLLKHIRKGSLGGCHVIADVGSLEKLEPLMITEKRIPTWILPNGGNGGTTGNSSVSAAASRIDIVMPHVPTHRVPLKGRLLKGTKITAIEVGFRGDHDPNDTKLAEKMAQHQTTCTALRRLYELDYQVWDIGYTGVIPARLLDHAKALGVSNPRKLLRELHRIAIEHAHLIVSERRHLERAPMDTKHNGDYCAGPAHPTNDHEPLKRRTRDWDEPSAAR